MVMLPDLPPAVAVIFTVPAFRPLTLPLESTVAMDSSEEFHFTVARPPSGLVVTVAFSCTLCVAARSMALSPETFTEVTSVFVSPS